MIHAVISNKWYMRFYVGVNSVDYQLIHKMLSVHGKD